MARWQDLVESEPDFARAVQALFDAHKHKTLATLRKDGSPRISGIEANFADGDLWLGMMPGSRKAQDVKRDRRMALHSPSVDPPEGNDAAWPGEAKVSGRAVEVSDPERLKAMGGGEDGGHLVRLDISEVVWTRLGEPADHLLITLWRPGKPLQETKRA